MEVLSVCIPVCFVHTKEKMMLSMLNNTHVQMKRDENWQKEFMRSYFTKLRKKKKIQEKLNKKNSKTWKTFLINENVSILVMWMVVEWSWWIDDIINF